MGTVRQLSGAVQGGVEVAAVEAVEARDGSSEEAAQGHAGVHFETATTVDDGSFRLRGLKPGAVYSVQVCTHINSGLCAQWRWILRQYPDLLH